MYLAGANSILSERVLNYNSVQYFLHDKFPVILCKANIHDAIC